MSNRPARKLAAVLHADVVGSTELVQLDESLAHERIRSTFQRFCRIITTYEGIAHELRGDAIVAEFARASDAACAALAFQNDSSEFNQRSGDAMSPALRVGISLAEVVIADGTMTGAGVVLAQRLEQLADSGGVVIQATAAETIPRRLPFDLENLGDQTLKGFEQPVRAYALRLRRGEQVPEADLPFAEDAAPVTPDKPSIAVLPFVNMSGDAEQEYFSDGITEDIITDLSKVSGLFVVARHSSFSFKDTTLDVTEIGTALGVRYLLEGSVRRAGDRLRINAQLLDAASGSHLWAERYDGALAEVFDLQDRITENVVAALAVTLTRAEQQRAMNKPTQHLKAYDYVLRGNAYHHLMTREDNAKAKKMYEQAIALDPGCAPAHAGLAWALVHDFNQAWTSQPEQSMRRALEHARQAVSLDDGLAMAHLALGDVYLWSWQQDQAVTEGRRAIALDPSYADGHFALAVFLTYAGHAEEAVLQAKKALRFNPVHANRLYYIALARASFGARNYQDAVQAAEQSLARGFTRSAHVLMAASYAQLGRMVDARRHAEEHLKTDPGFSLDQAMRRVPYKDPADLAHIVNALCKAGLR